MSDIGAPMFLKFLLFFFLTISSLAHAQAPSALLHKVDKAEIFKTFEIKPFDFDPAMIENMSDEEARRKVLELALLNGGDNLVALSRYAELPMTFWKSEMHDTYLRASVMINALNKRQLQSPQLKDEVNEVIKKMLENFLNRPYVDLYYDSVEIVKKIENMQKLGGTEEAISTEKPINVEREGMFGISAATPESVSLLALALAIAGFLKSFSSTNSSRERRR